MNMFMNADYMIFNILALVMSGVGYLVQNVLKSKFARYSAIPLRSGQSGKEIAEKMLRYYNINDVRVLESQGF